MAKKPQTPATPEITVLPMAGADSPMVIDLPDGQKLIVSNLAAGSVIEVATWRGTGRPDSRTTRLMLGMTSGQAQSADAVSVESKEPSLSKEKIALSKAGALLGKLISKVNERKNNLAEKKKKAPLIEKVVPAARSSDDQDVDDWLNSILEKSAKKKAPVKPAIEKIAEPKPIAKKAPAKKTVKKTAKKTTTGRAR